MRRGVLNTDCTDYTDYYLGNAKSGSLVPL